MTGKRAETLLELMHQIEHFTLARAWGSLTDDEFFWQPFTTAWSIRRQDQCRTPNPFGAGEWVADFAIPEPTPVPMTTIAWLYWHIGSMPGRLCDIDLLGGTRTMASGWTSPYLTPHPIFTSAAEAASQLRDGWQRLRGAIERADDGQLEVTTAGYTYAAEPPRGGLCVVGPPGPAHPATHFIAGALTEVAHHGTQIGALRDIYAWRRSPPADPALPLDTRVTQVTLMQLKTIFACSELPRAGRWRPAARTEGYPIGVGYDACGVFRGG